MVISVCQMLPDVRRGKGHSGYMWAWGGKEDCRQTEFSLGTCKLCIRVVARRALSLWVCGPGLSGLHNPGCSPAASTLLPLLTEQGNKQHLSCSHIFLWVILGWGVGGKWGNFTAIVFKAVYEFHFVARDHLFIFAVFIISMTVLLELGRIAMKELVRRWEKKDSMGILKSTNKLLFQPFLAYHSVVVSSTFMLLDKPP